MDIALLSLHLSTMNLNTQAATSVLKLSMNQMDIVSDGMKKIMETSVCPEIGSNLDISI